jgi:aspartate--ammonia ligase
MNKIYIPAGYTPVLDEYDTQRAIAYIKKTFQDEFAGALNLKRVSAPLFVTADSGLNDNLNGFERPVSFDVPAVGNDAQVVHSLAKWKRLALKRYGFGIGGGQPTQQKPLGFDGLGACVAHGVHLLSAERQSKIDRCGYYIRQSAKFE